MRVHAPTGRGRQAAAFRATAGPVSTVAVPVLCLMAVVATAACGKKGPPLAPIVRIPAAVTRVAARRVGDDVFVTLTVPAANIDETTPADVERVEVYAYTGLTPPPRGRFIENASLIATVPVAPPALPPGAGRAPATPAPPPAANGALQGAVVTLRETLTEDELTPRALAPPLVRGRRPPAVVSAEPPDAALRRYYLAVPFGDKGRPGPQGPPAALPLTLLPETPSVARVTYTATTVALEWEPSGGLVGYVLDRSLPDEAPPSDRFSETALRGAPLLPGNLPPGATGYNVYRSASPDPLAIPVNVLPRPSWAASVPAAVNATPLTTPVFTEPVAFDGRQVCYEVRAVRGTGVTAVEGAPSRRVCVVPYDTFPPAPPRGVSAVTAEGVIDLVWEPNAETDLTGYVVLRGEAGDATLTPLFDRPVPETRFSDRTVVPGRRYVYAVVAADNRVPLANISPESAPVEETAR